MEKLGLSEVNLMKKKWKLDLATSKVKVVSGLWGLCRELERLEEWSLARKAHVLC